MFFTAIEDVGELLRERRDLILDEALFSVDIKRTVSITSVLGKSHKSLREFGHYVKVFLGYSKAQADCYFLSNLL